MENFSRCTPLWRLLHQVLLVLSLLSHLSCATLCVSDGSWWRDGRRAKGWGRTTRFTRWQSGQSKITMLLAACHIGLYIFYNCSSVIWDRTIFFMYSQHKTLFHTKSLHSVHHHLNDSAIETWFHISFHQERQLGLWTWTQGHTIMWYSKRPCLSARRALIAGLLGWRIIVNNINKQTM